MSNFQPVNPQQYMQQQQGQQQNPYVQGMQQPPQQPQQQEAQPISVGADFFNELAQPKSAFLSPKECPPDGWLVKVIEFLGVFAGTYGNRVRVKVEIINGQDQGQTRVWEQAPSYSRAMMKIGGIDNPPDLPTKCLGVIMSLMPTMGNNGKPQFVVTQVPGWMVQNLQQQGVVTPSQPPQEEAFPTS